MRLLFLLASAAFAADPQLVSVARIWDQGSHNAFTDITHFRGRWYITFREADDHVGGDGRIRVLTSAKGDRWESAALIAEDGIDLRDPKFSITPDNRLMIVAGGSVYGGTKILKGRQPRVLFSRDGKSWTKPQRILSEGHWLWRVTWHKGRAYGVTYDHTGAPGSQRDAQGRAPEWSIQLAESDNGTDWRIAAQLSVPGRPNETTLRFLPDGTCMAFIRREGLDKRAWIGTAKPPYREWSFHPTEHQIGGPNFIVLPDGRMVGGGRDYRGAPKHVTSIGALTTTSYTPQISFPSAGDNSYPGFVWRDNLLWVSYYSTHEGKTSIYLAKVKLP